MIEVINLNRKRKAKARAEKETKSAENRRKYGRTKEEKQLDKKKAEKLKRHLEGHKREKEDE
jgi:hypothetical protein